MKKRTTVISVCIIVLILASITMLDVRPFSSNDSGSTLASTIIWGPIGNQIVGSWFETGVNSGTADSITAYLSCKESQRVKLAIYEYIAEGDAGALVGSTEEIKADKGTGWVTFNFVDPKPSIEIHTKYFLVAWGKTYGVELAYVSMEGKGIWTREQWIHGDWSDPLTNENVEDHKYLIYCDYAGYRSVFGYNPDYDRGVGQGRFEGYWKGRREGIVAGYPPIPDIGNRKQLFIDDYIIESMEGVQKVLNQPEKYPENPIIVMDQPWEVGTFEWPIGRTMTDEEMEMADKEGMLAYCSGSIEYDKEEGIYKMWAQITSYLWSHSTVAYLTSSDGIHWEKPKLGLVEYRGYDTNLLIDPEDPLWTPSFDGQIVFKDPVETDESRRYKMMYHTARYGAYGDLCVAFSPDGIHWTPWEEGNPIGKSDAPDVVFWDYNLERYVAHPRCSDELVYRYREDWPPYYLRVPGRIESTDFEHWSKKVPIMKADELDSPYNRQFYEMSCMQYEGVYIGYIPVYHIVPEYEYKELGPKPMDYVDVQLTFSRDGRTWMRAGDRDVFIPNSPIEGTYDWGLIWPLQEPLPIIDDVTDEIWIYYAGQPGLHWFYSRGELQEGSMCLAKLRLDGFISIDALEDEGTFTTKPFQFEGDRLEINANAEGGFIYVEVLDQDDQPILGFSKGDCDPLTSDEVHHIVTWNEESDLSDLQGQTIKLRFYMKNAKLFSFVLKK